MKIAYLKNPKQIPLAFVPIAKGGRTFVITMSIEVTLSDGSILIIPKGMQTDLSSIPSWLWSILKPMDKALIGDIIHDALWVQQASETKKFGGAYQARKFADNERLKWRKALAPKKKIKNYITHYTIRLIGGLFYSRQLEIPN